MEALNHRLAALEGRNRMLRSWLLLLSFLTLACLGLIAFLLNQAHQASKAARDKAAESRPSVPSVVEVEKVVVKDGKQVKAVLGQDGLTLYQGGDVPAFDLGVLPDKGVGLKMYDGLGKERARLTVRGEQVALEFLDQGNRGRVSLNLEKSAQGLVLRGPPGQNAEALFHVTDLGSSLSLLAGPKRTTVTLQAGEIGSLLLLENPGPNTAAALAATADGASLSLQEPKGKKTISPGEKQAK
jgi:hypothetical protein